MIEELKMQASEQAKLDWLREQIEMRVIGLCWVEFKAHWSSGSNESVGSVEDLTGGRECIPYARPTPLLIPSVVPCSHTQNT